MSVQKDLQEQLVLKWNRLLIALNRDAVALEDIEKSAKTLIDGFSIAFKTQTSAPLSEPSSVSVTPAQPSLESSVTPFASSESVTSTLSPSTSW